jgi:hypothetical protein
MNQFRLQHIYTQKCHKEPPCIATLNKKKGSFFILSSTELEDRRAEQVLPWVVGTSGSREEVGKRHEKVRMV